MRFFIALSLVLVSLTSYAERTFIETVVADVPITPDEQKGLTIEPLWRAYSECLSTGRECSRSGSRIEQIGGGGARASATVESFTPNNSQIAGSKEFVGIAQIFHAPNPTDLVRETALIEAHDEALSQCQIEYQRCAIKVLPHYIPTGHGANTTTAASATIVGYEKKPQE